MSNQFFDDIVIGSITEYEPFYVDHEEMLDFNKKWDKLPIHIDDDAARELGHRGIIASGQFTLCIKQFFINQSDWRDAVIGAAGWDDVRFKNPVYAGDNITGRIRCIDKIPSRSKTDRGILKFEIILTNQDNDIVLSLLDSVMIRKNPGEV
ncbi:MAG: MaoC/PaaZ C-terminal domain-containing protein [Gammaproteobacteria bacterium]|jgi:acyl dehydratase